MDQAALFEQLKATMLLFLIMAGPPLCAALVVGLVVGLLQAATQIQDQTMPLTFKIITVIATLAAMSSVIFPPLIERTKQIMDDLPALTRW